MKGVFKTLLQDSDVHNVGGNIKKSAGERVFNQLVELILISSLATAESCLKSRTHGFKRHELQTLSCR